MPEDKNPQQRRVVREKAMSAATGAGKNWKQLSKDERKPFLRQARKDAGATLAKAAAGGGKGVAAAPVEKAAGAPAGKGAAGAGAKPAAGGAKDARKKAIQQQARLAAKKAGLTWAKMSKEERVPFRKQARSALQKQGAE